MLAHDGEGWVPGARNWLAITCVMHSALTLSSAPMRGCLQLVGTRQVDLASDDPGPSAQQLCDLEQVVDLPALQCPSVRQGPPSCILTPGHQVALVLTTAPAGMSLSCRNSVHFRMGRAG